MKLITDAIINNRCINGETVPVFEAYASDCDGNEYMCVWDNPDWDKANGFDFSECCDWEHPDRVISVF